MKKVLITICLIVIFLTSCVSDVKNLKADAKKIAFLKCKVREKMSKVIGEKDVDNYMQAMEYATQAMELQRRLIEKYSSVEDKKSFLKAIDDQERICNGSSETTQGNLSKNKVKEEKQHYAIISADSVMYRGLDNPLTISMFGTSDNSVNARACGLRKLEGNRYLINPRAGDSVCIRVSSKTIDGKSVSDKKYFKIKDIPIVTMINGKHGSISMSKESISKINVKAMALDLPIPLKFSVSRFKLQVSDKPTISVNGSRMTSRARKVIRECKKGQIITVFDVQVRCLKARITSSKAKRMLIKVK